MHKYVTVQNIECKYIRELVHKSLWMLQHNLVRQKYLRCSIKNHFLVYDTVQRPSVPKYSAKVSRSKVCSLKSKAHFYPPHSSLLILHFSKLETREPKLTKPTVKVNQKTCIEFAEAEDLMCKKKKENKIWNKNKRLWTVPLQLRCVVSLHSSQPGVS